MGGRCCKSNQDSGSIVQPVDAKEVGPEDPSPQSQKKLNFGAPEDGAGLPASYYEQRLSELEATIRQQADEMKLMKQSLASVQRDCRRTVSVLQYNILASYLGQNTQPWFLYGAEVSSADRKRILERYQERQESGQPRYTWPAYADGILSAEDIAAVERKDEDFRWPVRRQRLRDEVRALDADVLSLVELDQHDYFAQALGDTWDTTFHKRPRAVSHDGCGLFWRRSKFAMEARQAFDFVDGADQRSAKKDRGCLMVLLRWRACGSPLVIVSTHLAKNPDCRSQTALRVRQVMQIMEGLTDFTTEHKALDAPVILMGDLNAKHLAEIRGLARTVWQVRGSPIHKFLWSASDVPTGPTSVTKARQCRIDIVQFLSSQLEVLEVKPTPKLAQGEVIPNAEHPSDHFPVWVRFQAKDNYQTHRECAHAWLECVAGREKLHPLTETELEVAFEFFDRDRSATIHRHDLEEACLDLQCNFHGDVQRCLLDCFPDQQISYENFVKAYEVRFTHERMRCIGDLEYAFQYFAKDGKRIDVAKLEEVFREITPISFEDEEIDQMIQRLNIQPGQEFVDLRRFCQVICKSSFPHKRRRTPTMTFEPVASTGQDARCTVRTGTGEIAVRLEQLHQNLSGSWQPGLLSPSAEERAQQLKLEQIMEDVDSSAIAA